MRGPLVYCLESWDLPDGVGAFDVLLPRSIELTEVRETQGPLAGMTVLKANALARRENTGFESPLYRELSTEPAREAEITLIPYFAWANRGASEMSVWLPLAA